MKYKPEDIKPLNIDKHLANYPQLYFGPDGASESGVVNIISETAKLLGARTIHVTDIGNLKCIGADLDWLRLENDYGLNEDNIFDCMWPFPEAGVNSARIEIIARVYASILVSARMGKLTVHKGHISQEQEEEILALANTCKRLICFKYQDVSRHT